MAPDPVDPIHPDDVAPRDLSDDLHRVIAGLRPRPAVWLPAIDGWLVIGHPEATAVLRDATTFTVDDPRFSTARVLGPSMLSTDGDEHRRHRRPFLPLFDRRSVAERAGAVVESGARELVTGLAAEGRADLRHRLAAPLAVRTIIDVLDLDVDDDVMLTWYRDLVAGVEAVSAGEDVPTTASIAADRLRRRVWERADDPSSPLGRIAADGSLTPEALFANSAVAAFGAIETGEAMTANALWHLLAEPTWLDRLRSRPDLVAPVIEESLRLEPAAAVVDRYATADATIGDARIPAGDLVRVSLTGANRDPRIFAEPDRFDPHRSYGGRHLSFVPGPHACIGAHLARAATTAAVRAVLDGLPDLAIDGDASSPPSGAIFRKPPALVATWSPRRPDGP
ncbi:MAG: cytochrome P450 [Actinomycetota bacterium]